MIKGVLKSGFKFEMDDEAMDDIEFVELIAETEENATALPKLAKTMLGEKQYKALKDHLRNDKGRVPLESVSNALEEMFDVAGDEAKNSEPSPE